MLEGDGLFDFVYAAAWAYLRAVSIGFCRSFDRFIPLLSVRITCYRIIVRIAMRTEAQDEILKFMSYGFSPTLTLCTPRD